MLLKFSGDDSQRVLLPRQFLKVMKITAILLFAAFLQVSATGSAQITLSLKNAPFEKVLQAIEKQTNYDFLYTKGILKDLPQVTINVRNASIREVLNDCFKNQPLEYAIEDRVIVITRKTRPGYASIPESKKLPPVQLRGRVTDNDGNPLANVSVIVVGTSVGTATDAAGNYMLTAPDAQNITLEFSSVGYTTERVSVGQQKVINVTLKLQISAMDEMVVVGYGSVRRGDLTGSISSVPKEVLDNTTFSDLGQAIQGQVAGVHILTGDGSPGEEVQVTVRGISSFLGNTSPLLVVDGVPMPSDFNLNDLNPNNIQSVDVLKGASASAIYGSRASSGVLLIQTKQGNFNQKPTINYSYNFGVDQMSSKIDVLTVDEWKYLLFEGVKNAAIADGLTNIESSTHWKNYTAPGFFREEKGTNWQKEMMQPSTLQTHNLSINGGTATTRYTSSVGLTNDQGIMKESGFKRYNINLGLNNRISPKLTSDLSVRANFSDRDAATATVYDALFGRPDYPAYNDDGTPFVNIYYLANGDPRLLESPLSKLLDNLDKQKSHAIGISGYLQYDILKNLSIRSRVNYNQNDSRRKLFYASTTSAGSGTGFTKMGSLSDTRTGSEQLEWENQLNYSYRYQSHRFDLTGVTSFLQETRTMSSINFDDFPDNHVQNEFYQGATYKSSSGYINKAAMISYVGRLNYNYKGRYLLTTSVRRDGSSKFAPRNAYGTFPSLAVAWNITQEPFLKKATWLNFLKLRGGIGKTGMADVGFYAWHTLYGATNYLGEPGVIPSQAGNDDLRWETSVQTDMAIDFQLFNTRLRGSVGYYTKNTDGLLYPFTLAPSTGFSRATVNFAKVNNKGFDIDLQFDVISKPGFTWTIGGNFNNNRNTVLKLDKDYITGSDGGQALSNTIIKEGEPFGLIYGFKTDGIYKSWDQVYKDRDAAAGTGFAYQRYLFPGEIRFFDLDGDGFVNTGVQTPIGNTDRTILGHSLPDFSGGISTFLNYRQWNLRVFGTYSVGNDKVWVQELYSFTQAVPAHPRNGWKIALDRWTPENPDSKYPSYRLNRTTISREFNDFSVYDASYLKIQNVQLLYDLNRQTLSKLKVFSRIQVYASVNNLYTFTNYPGLNPESFSRGDRITGASLDYSLYPSFRTFNFGIKTILK